jgi:aminomethyltransferase
MDDRAAYEAIRRTAGAYRRATRFAAVTGVQRGDLLSYALAKSTEYAQPDTAVESLALDADGRPVDFVMALFEEDRVILLSEAESGLIDQLPALAEELGLDAVAVAELPGWTAVGVEGPKSWAVVADLIEDDVAGLTLNQVRPSVLPDGLGSGGLARVGMTAEYGYLWLGEADGDQVLDLFAGRAAAVGGAVTTPAALRRAAMEVNQPLFPEMYEGLSLREAGAEWVAGAGRDDDFRGRPAEDSGPRSRGLVAVTAEAADLPPVGTAVEAGGQPVGTVFLAADRCGQPDGFGLALLDVPFDVPGLALTAAGAALRTVARPAVDPRSWAEAIG